MNSLAQSLAFSQPRGSGQSPISPLAMQLSRSPTTHWAELLGKLAMVGVDNWGRSERTKDQADSIAGLLTPGASKQWGEVRDAAGMAPTAGGGQRRNQIAEMLASNPELMPFFQSAALEKQFPDIFGEAPELVEAYDEASGTFKLMPAAPGLTTRPKEQGDLVEITLADGSKKLVPKAEGLVTNPGGETGFWAGVGGGAAPAASDPNAITATPLLNRNNPGNIRNSNGEGFRSYATPEEGLADMARLLGDYQTKHGLNTVEGIISRWAPPTENDTPAYIGFVADKMGISPTDPIDVNDPQTKAALMDAMITMEHGKQPFAPDQLLSVAGGQAAGSIPPFVPPVNGDSAADFKANAAAFTDYVEKYGIYDKISPAYQNVVDGVRRERESEGDKTTFANADKLRDEFQKAVDPLGKILSGYKDIKTGYEDQSGAGDIKLIFGYMKMLDPGGRVTEGEYATTQNAAGVPESIRSLYNQVIGGGSLSPGLRSQILESSESLATNAKQKYEGIAEVYTGLSSSFGLDPSLVIVDTTGLSKFGQKETEGNSVPTFDPETMTWSD